LKIGSHGTLRRACLSTQIAAQADMSRRQATDVVEQRRWLGSRV